MFQSTNLPQLFLYDEPGAFARPWQSGVPAGNTDLFTDLGPYDGRMVTNMANEL